MKKNIAIEQSAKTHYFYPLIILNIVFVMICVPTAGKIVDFFGTPLSISLFYFPFVYVISDVMTEVYGYAYARRALWYTILSQALMVSIFMIAAWWPASPVMDEQAANAFTIVLSQTPLLAIMGTIAVISGDFSNNYIVAKMKVWFKGHFLSLRLVTSTAVGQFINSLVFYVGALWFVIPWNDMIYSIIFGALTKTAIEVICLPFSIWLINKLKKAENLDVFDKETNFNPFKF